MLLNSMLFSVAPTPIPHMKRSKHSKPLARWRNTIPVLRLGRLENAQVQRSANEGLWTMAVKRRILATQSSRISPMDRNLPSRARGINRMSIHCRMRWHRMRISSRISAIFNLPGNGAASAFDPDFNVTPNQPMNNGYPYSLFRAPAPGPSGQQQYQGQGVSLNTPNLSGFGVTGPAPGWPVASTSQPAVQLSGGMDPLTPSMYGSTPSSGTGTKSKSPINGAERQRQLRQAVAIITKNESSGKMDGGPETSLAEIEHNMRLQNQLRQSMEENEGPDLKTEAMQVGELVQSR